DPLPPGRGAPPWWGEGDSRRRPRCCGDVVCGLPHPGRHVVPQGPPRPRGQGRPAAGPVPLRYRDRGAAAPGGGFGRYRAGLVPAKLADGADTCTRLREILRLAVSMPITFTCTVSPTISMSSVRSTWSQDSSEMWSRPSLPGTICRKAPYFLVFVTWPPTIE